MAARKSAENLKAIYPPQRAGDGGQPGGYLAGGRDPDLVSGTAGIYPGTPEGGARYGRRLSHWIALGDMQAGIYHNSVISLGRVNGFYHKRRLLPFGEYLPLRTVLDFFRRYVDIPMADFTPGGGEQPLLQAAGCPVGISICFEAVFGSEIRRSLPQAQWLVNVSNDAWFGHSLAPYQHLQINRMRALEAGRWLARATNTGLTAIIDERGRIVAQGEPFVAEVVRGQVQPLTGATPYVRCGDSCTVVLLAVLLALALWLRLAQSVDRNKRSISGT